MGRSFRHFALLAVFVSFPTILWADFFQQVAPETVGMSTERLNRLRSFMQGEIDKKATAGVVSLIIRDGKIVFFESLGKRDVEAGAPMQSDTIFRIASQTKAFTTVAAMMLVEEGKLALTDPVSKYIKAFKKTTVLASPAGKDKANPKTRSIPANREITIRDLMTHTSGIPYAFAPAPKHWKAAGIEGGFFVDRNEPMAAIVNRIAAVPMDAHPGEKFIYGFNTDILGVVVEEVSGLTLADFFQKRICGPLGLKDTVFFLDAQKKDCLAALYMINDRGVIERERGPMGSDLWITGPKKAFSGGGGLLSTAEDYARFLQMLLNGGAIDGIRLLSPKTIELMTSNHVGALFENGDQGFGLGFALTLEVGKDGRYSSDGAYGWGGAFKTTYWVDPKEKMIGVFMTQISSPSKIRETFRTLAYQSIIGPLKQ